MNTPPLPWADRRWVALVVLVAILGMVLTLGLVVRSRAAQPPGGTPQQVTLSMRDFRFASHRYRPANLDVRPGRVHIAIRNDDIVTHDVTLPDLGVASGPIAPGGTAQLTIDVPAGLYAILCTRPFHGHQAGGPVGYLWADARGRRHGHG